MSVIFWRDMHQIGSYVGIRMSATAECGWFPPNRKLVEHPSLVKKQKETVLNVDEGFSGSVLNCLLRERSRSDGAKKAAEKRKLTSNAISENIKNHRDSLLAHLPKMLSTVLMTQGFLSHFTSINLNMK